jgi:hypothetical protein
LRKQSAALADYEFEDAFNEYFVTLRSDGSEVELIPGGSKIRVSK